MASFIRYCAAAGGGMGEYMKKILVLILLISTLSATNVQYVEAAKDNDIHTLPIGKTTKGKLESGVTKLYEIKPSAMGFLTIRIKSSLSDPLHTSLYPNHDSELALTNLAICNDSLGCAPIEYKVFVNPITYYLTITNPIIVNGGDYEITTSFKKVSTAQDYADHSTMSTAASISNNMYYKDIMAFNDTQSYYRFKVKKNSSLKLKIYGIDIYTLNIDILDSAGNSIDRGTAFSKENPYQLDKPLAAGDYFVMITRRNSSSEMYGFQHVIITGDYTPIKKISLPSKKTLSIGSTYTFKPTLTPKNAGKALIYTSSNAKVVKVNKDGKITAMSKGSATITVTTIDGGLKSTCKVTVQDTSVSKITLSKTSLSLKVGDSTTLKTTISPKAAAKETVTWKTSNTKVATVSSTGLVKAKGTGTCKITATAKGKSVTATVKVTAKPTPKPVSTPTPAPTTIGVNTITVKDKFVLIPAGSATEVSVSIIPGNASNQDLLWDYDSSIIKIENTTITALKAGSTTVTVRSAGNSNAVAYFTVKVN